MNNKTKNTTIPEKKEAQTGGNFDAAQALMNFKGLPLIGNLSWKSQYFITGFLAFLFVFVSGLFFYQYNKEQANKELKDNVSVNLRQSIKSLSLNVKDKAGQQAQENALSNFDKYLIDWQSDFNIPSEVQLAIKNWKNTVEKINLLQEEKINFKNSSNSLLNNWSSPVAKIKANNNWSFGLNADVAVNWAVMINQLENILVDLQSSPEFTVAGYGIREMNLRWGQTLSQGVPPEATNLLPHFNSFVVAWKNTQKDIPVIFEWNNKMNDVVKDLEIAKNDEMLLLSALNSWDQQRYNKSKQNIVFLWSGFFSFFVSLIFIFLFVTVKNKEHEKDKLLSLQEKEQTDYYLLSIIAEFEPALRGDVGKRIKSNASGLLGSLGDGLNHVIQDWANVLRQSRKTTDVSKKHLEDSLETIQFLYEASHSQSNNFIEYRKQAERLLENVQEQSKWIPDLVKKAEASVLNATEGKKAANDLSNRILSIRTKLEETKTRSESFRGALEEAKKTSMNLQGMSEQMEVLAVQAALLAGRVTEQNGKSFDGVATVLRRLAEQSMIDSTKMQALVFSFEQDNEVLIQTTKKAIEGSDEILRLSDLSDISWEEINRMISEMSLISGTLQEKSTQQYELIKSIENKVLSEISKNENVQKYLQTIQESTAATGEQIQSLEMHINRYKVVER